MAKSLEEMTLDELWQLFPIALKDHNDRWFKLFSKEKEYLQQLIPCENMGRISHVGSTYINNIKAKPILDILVELKSIQSLNNVSEKLKQNGYRLMNESENRISLNKGYTNEGFANEVYHIHLRGIGDCDELYFRDYLTNHPDVAKAYEKLKIQLAEKYRHNRDVYTNEKSDFILKYTSLAKILYADKYNII